MGNNIDTSSYTAYSSGGTVSKVYEISTPYAKADLHLLKFEQSADVLSIFHPSYDERSLTRTGHTAWTLSTVTYAAGITAPTGFTGNTGTTNTYAATAVSEDGYESVPSSTDTADAGETVSWNVVSDAEYYNVYQLVNGLYKFVGSSESTTFTTPTSAADDDFTAPKAKNPFSGADNRPGVGAYFQQRMTRARTNNKPQTVYPSVTGDF